MCESPDPLDVSDIIVNIGDNYTEKRFHRWHRRPRLDSNLQSLDKKTCW